MFSTLLVCITKSRNVLSFFFLGGTKQLPDRYRTWRQLGATATKSTAGARMAGVPESPAKVSSVPLHGELRTPDKTVDTSGTAPSPLSKANTPQRQHSPKCVDDDDKLHVDAVHHTASASPAPAVSDAPAVSGKCRLLRWAAAAHQRRQLAPAVAPEQDQLALPSNPRSALRKPHSGTHRAHSSLIKARWFGDWSEEEPDEYLLCQDLIAMHKRGAEEVSVTILSDDAFDVSALVGAAGSGDIDAAHLPQSADDVLAIYSEEHPEEWLLHQDLVALAKSGVERASVVMMLKDDDGAEDGGQWGSPQWAEEEIEADLCGEVQYDPDDPEPFLLQQDLVALAKRGAEMVTVTVLADQELTEDDVSALLWPCGSGHLDLAYHFQDAAPYPQGEVDSWGAREEDELSDYLLLQDLIALQKAGSDAVSITMVASDDGDGSEAHAALLRDCDWARARGFEVCHVWEEPSSLLLHT